MIFELMHKNIPVADISLNEEGRMEHILAIRDLRHFPFGTEPRTNPLDSTELKRWWDNRQIPFSRNGLANVRGVVLPEGAPTSLLVLHASGLSLSDSYWIRQKGSQTRYEEVNFFENRFSYDLGDALLLGKQKDDVIYLSPDATTDGDLAKRWKIRNGKRVLLKSGIKPYFYQVYNEVIASFVCAYLDVPHADYRLVRDDGMLLCECEDFVSYSQDFVTAYMLYRGCHKANDESNYSYLLRLYEELGIEGARKNVDQMLLIDYLLGNEDRHLNNFGLLRDANSLEFLGVAPLFDTGSCLGYELTDEELESSSPRPWKPFRTASHVSPLDYIDELPLDHKEALLSLPRALKEYLQRDYEGLSPKRKRAIASFVSSRVHEVVKHFGLELAPTFGLSKTQQSIMDYARTRGGRIDNAGDLASSLGIAKLTALRNIALLVEQGYLRRDGSKKTGHWTLL